MSYSVGVVGLGAIGSVVAAALDKGVPGLVLTAVAGRAPSRTTTVKGMAGAPAAMSAGELAAACDVIVDCAPPQAFSGIAEPALRFGKVLVTVNGSAILEHPDLVALAKVGGGRIILASGALLGLDAVRAAAEGVKIGRAHV